MCDTFIFKIILKLSGKKTPALKSGQNIKLYYDEMEMSESYILCVPEKAGPDKRSTLQKILFQRG